MVTVDFGGLSYSFYTGDGVTTTFPINFSTIDPSHLVVTLDGALQVINTDYTIVGTDVVFVAGPVATGVDIRLIRVTPRELSNREVDFRSYGSITEDEMDLNQKQIWYLIQEAMETDDAGNVNPNAEYIGYDALKNRWTALRTFTDQRIGDVADPVEADDAATKAYVDDIAEWGIAGIPQGWTITALAATSIYTLAGGTLMDARYLLVALDGVVQVPLVDFIIYPGDPDSQISFTVDPPEGAIINIMNFGKARFLNVSVVGENAVGSLQIQAGAVGTSKLADDAVTSAKLGTNAVDTEHILSGAVDSDELSYGSVEAAHLKVSGFGGPAGSYDAALMSDKTTGDLEHRAITSLDISDWLTALGNVRITQLAAPNTDLNMATNKIINVVDPSDPQGAATKNYVDTAISGGTGSKIDLVADVSKVGASLIWDVTPTQPAAWMQDPDYLYYELVFSNWRSIIAGWVYISTWNGTWTEACRTSAGAANTGGSTSEYPAIWKLYLTNPRTAATRPAFKRPAEGGISYFGPDFPFNEASGIRVRTEVNNITDGTRCQVYGHKA